METVDSVLANVFNVQNALKVFATILQLTNYFFYQDPPVQPLDLDGNSFDFIIVGGGTAGCLIAARLSEVAEFNVLLVEAGDVLPIEALEPSLFAYTAASRVDWNITSCPDNFIPLNNKNEQYHMTQGKMISGSDGSNYMVYVRGDPRDYNTWAKMTNDSSWKYSNILKYFKKSEMIMDETVKRSSYGVYHGTEGEIGVTKLDNNITLKYFTAIQEMGFKKVIDTNGPNTLGFTQPLVTIGKDGLHQSSAFKMLSPARHRKNLRILTKAYVTKLIIDKSKTVKGVKIYLENEDKFITVNAKKEVIVSAGALQTPKLLQLSGIGPKDDLEKLGIDVIVDLPVGDNLQDHRMVPLIFQGAKSNASTPPVNPKTLPVAIINGFVALNKSQWFPDYEVVMIVNPHDSPALLQLCTFSFQMKDYVCNKIYEAGIGREVLFTFIDFLLPKSRGRVTLQSTNFRDLPKVCLGTFSDKSDLVNHAKYVAHFKRIVDTDFFKAIKGKMVDITNCSSNYEYDTIEYFICYVYQTVQTVWHYCGTCAMGLVTDSRMKVKGMSGLRTIDACSMPKITRGNTLVPVYMLAEKGCDMIKEDHGIKISTDDNKKSKPSTCHKN